MEFPEQSALGVVDVTAATGGAVVITVTVPVAKVQPLPAAEVTVSE